MEAEEDKEPMQPDGAPPPPATQDDLIEEEGLRALRECDHTDFDAWTSLVTETERASPNDVKRIRVVYDAFLSEFPLCFGYWTKYASQIARLCTLNEVQKVYERAVQAATYSVDLWVSYCSFGILSYEDPADVRRLFARALSFVGKDYLCYLLWDKYIEFEYSQKQWSFLAHVYISTLKFPTKKLDGYYESLRKLIVIWEEEMGCQNISEMPSEAVHNGEADGKVCEYAEISNVIRDLLDGQNDHCRSDAVKKYLSVGEQLYHRSIQLDRKINLFEARIRRPYFHVKPLDDCQLENWHQYLDFVEMEGDFDWTVKLYERCLIACANYSEFWIRYVEFVNAKGGREIANHALGRALTFFLKKVPAFHLYCAMFMEQVGDATGARASFLRCSAYLTPEFIQNVKREANMEKRLGNTEAACMIYEKSIAMAKLKGDSHAFSILYENYALFTLVVTGSADAAVEVFIRGVKQMPCKSILEGFIHFVTMHGGARQISNVDAIISDTISPNTAISQALSCNDHEDISTLFLEFVDLHGTITEIREAWDRHRKLFPHIMTPRTTCYNTTSGNHTPDKIMEARKDTFVASLHVDGGSRHDDSHMRLKDGPIQNSAATLAKEVVVCNLQTESNNKDVQMEREEHVEISEVQNESILETVELHVEVNKSIQENHDVSQSYEWPLKNPKIEHSEQGHGECELGDGVRPPSFDNPSINSPDNETRKSKPSCHDHDGGHETTSRSPGDEVQGAHESSEASAVHVSNKTHVRPNTPSESNLQNDKGPLCPLIDPIPSEVGRGQEFRTEVRSQSNSQQQLPVGDSYPCSTGSGGNLAQMHYGGRGHQSSSTEIHENSQSSKPQQWHIQAHVQYPPTSTNSQMVLAQGYPDQPQTWKNTEDQQASQSQSQYKMTGQAYPTSDSAWSGQSAQGLGYTQPHLSTQSASNPQTQVSQQTQLSNEHYGYIQSSQGYLSNIWQYYQQHLYYLQQQQLQIQQQMHQLQQQQVNQQDQHQYSSQFQQQSQQVHNQQQQKNLVYLQQQQHIVVQQQQQLVIFQQQHQQLLQQWQQQNQHQQQQQQYQQLVQQHQQLFQQQQQQLLQQQQQLLQHQQQLAQQQQQQQMNALDLQSEGAKIQSPGPSMRSYPPELQASPSK